MTEKEIRGVPLSRLSLGTVQLGVDYGIHNETGKPDRQHAFAILDEAVRCGVTVLDTARGYGESETVIGAWLRERKNDPSFRAPFIVTKAGRLDHASPLSVKDSLRRSAETSLLALGLEKLPLLMVHTCDDYSQDPEAVSLAFEDLQREGLIGLKGISAYSRHDYRAIASSGFDAVQVPVNLFDWKQIENGGLAALREAGMLVFIRSVYLQGLVFQDPASLDPRMEFARGTLETFRDFCRKWELTPAQLAVAFGLSLPEADSLALGSETVAQVRENAVLVEDAPRLTPAQMEELRVAFRDSEPHLLNPATWFNAM